MSNVCEADGAICASVPHVTFCPAVVQPDGEEMNVNGDGSGSVTDTFEAVDGPLFVTTMR
jgi:hypothetical protein